MTRFRADSSSSSGDEASFLPHAGYCVAAFLAIARFVAGTLGYFDEDPRPAPSPQATELGSAAPAQDAAAPPVPSPSQAPMSGSAPTLRRMR